MTHDPTNPFVHPAQQRLLELIDEAERELMEEQDDTQPSHDPLQRFHMAREWGVEPWVAAMLPVSPDLATLQDQATMFTTDTDLARKALMAVIKQSLQALVLLEEYEDGELMALDDGQLVDFLQHLMNKLDTRIGRLRRPAEGELQEEQDPWSTQAVVQRSEEFLNPDEDDHTDHVHWAPKSEPDPDVQPGLAFTEPYPATVAGEGPVQDPPAPEILVSLHDDHDSWLNHSVVLNHRHNDVTAPHLHKNRHNIEWVMDPEHPMAEVQELPDQGRQPRLVPDEVEEKRRPPMSEAPFYGGDVGPATHVPEQPVDLDAAERALARETAQLRQSAAGSSAAQLGGRHASPDDTLDDQGETGRRARED